MLRFGGWKNVRLVNLSSEVVTKGWTLPVGLLWIDGDHRYEAVLRDVTCWQPFLLPNSLVIFDDVKNVRTGVPSDGPGKVVEEAVAGGLFELISAQGKTAALRYLGTPSV
jgi:hypothetical protein